MEQSDASKSKVPHDSTNADNSAKESDEFKIFLKNASRIVASWPEWKRKLLG